mgnify:CR=1 FL=1
MRKFKFLFLSALMVTGLVTFTACGMGNANDTSKPPYEDETNTNNNKYKNYHKHKIMPHF